MSGTPLTLALKEHLPKDLVTTIVPANFYSPDCELYVNIIRRLNTVMSYRSLAGSRMPAGLDQTTRTQQRVASWSQTPIFSALSIVFTKDTLQETANKHMTYHDTPW